MDMFPFCGGWVSFPLKYFFFFIVLTVSALLVINSDTNCWILLRQAAEEDPHPFCLFSLVC